MAEYYSDILPSNVNYKREMKESIKMPSSAADLLARVLPYMTFITVIDNPILTREVVPCEDHYSYTIAKILRTFLNYTVTTPKNPMTGRMEVVVTYDDNSRCAIESIMAWQTLVSIAFAVRMIC